MPIFFEGVNESNEANGTNGTNETNGNNAKRKSPISLIGRICLIGPIRP